VADSYNVRLHRARLYVINSNPIKLRRQATSFMQIPLGMESRVAKFFAGDDAAAESIVSPSFNKDAWIVLREKLRVSRIW